MLTLICSGWERWQDNRCLCWWSWVPAFQWHQRAPTSSFGWDTSLFWRLYPCFYYLLISNSKKKKKMAFKHIYVATSIFSIPFLVYMSWHLIFFFSSLLERIAIFENLVLQRVFPWQFFSDKKNENKEVAVDEFLPASMAHEAIQYSMYVCSFPFQLLLFTISGL